MGEGGGAKIVQKSVKYYLNGPIWLWAQAKFFLLSQLPQKGLLKKKSGQKRLARVFCTNVVWQLFSSYMYIEKAAKTMFVRKICT